MAVSETDQSQVCLKVEDLQSDPGQGGVGQKERTSVVEMYIAGNPAWTNLSGLSETHYINHTDVIEKERLSAISSFTNVWAGALYAKLAGEKGDRCVYFEPDPDPAKSVMRVAKNVEGNARVIKSYPWERVNFVYKVREWKWRERTYKCYIYTPANLDSYGLVVEVMGENVHFEPTPRHGHKPNFTTVHMKHKPKDRERTEDKYGLYVDAEDGKVKATTDRQLWTTFSIKPFSPQHPFGNVNWDLASCLDLKYQNVLQERMSALIPECCTDNVFVGALYFETSSRKDMDCAQIAYFESAEPRKPRMRVAETKEVSDYSWDRINFVYYQVAAESSEYTFQIFTPANHGTYGLKATEEELIFEKLPEGREREEYFTHFQIKRGVSSNFITTTTRHTTLGVYVDTKDGWKVKLTKKQEYWYWDKFWIAGHTLPSPEILASVEA